MKCVCILCSKPGRVLQQHCGLAPMCDYPMGAIVVTRKPKKVSTNMIHARELDITAVTTVSDLFELIDLPYRITKHAKVTLAPNPNFNRNENFSVPLVLRLEWRGEPE